MEIKDDRGDVCNHRLEEMKRVIQTVSRFIAGAGACLLIPLMLMTAIDVVGRDLFTHPIPGAIELSEFMLAVFILLGIPYTHQVRGFVEVSVFISRLPARARSIFNLMATLLSLFIFSILAWQGVVVAIGERTVSDMLRVPQYPFRLLIAVSAFLVCLQLLIDLGDAIKKLGQRES